MIEATVCRNTSEFCFEPVCDSLDSPHWIPFRKKPTNVATQFAISIINSFTKTEETVWIEESLFTEEITSLNQEQLAQLPPQLKACVDLKKKISDLFYSLHRPISAFKAYRIAYNALCGKSPERLSRASHQMPIGIFVFPDRHKPRLVLDSKDSLLSEHRRLDRRVKKCNLWDPEAPQKLETCIKIIIKPQMRRISTSGTTNPIFNHEKSIHDKLKDVTGVVPNLYCAEYRDKQGRISYAHIQEMYDCDLYCYLGTSESAVKLTEDEAIRVMSQLLKALAQIAKKNILIADLKPENTLIKGRGCAIRARFTDLEGAQDLSIGHNGFGRLTLIQLPPEYFLFPKPKISLAYDVWSLGLTLYTIFSLKNYPWSKCIRREENMDMKFELLKIWWNQNYPKMDMGWLDNVGNERVRKILTEMLQYDLQKRIKAGDAWELFKQSFPDCEEEKGPSTVR